MPEFDPIKQAAQLRDVGLPSRPEDAARRAALTVLQRAIEREHQGRSRRPWGARRRRRMVLTGAVAVGVCSVAGAGYAALSTPEKASAGISCHSDHQLDGSQTIHSLDGRSAIAVCASDWRAGLIDPSARSAPPLEACVDPAGGQAINVFATSDPGFCAALSLRADQSAGTGAGDQRFVALSRAIEHAYSATTGCTTETEARAIIRPILERQGLSDWTIQASSPFRSAQCAELGFDSDARIVYLVPTDPTK